MRLLRFWLIPALAFYATALIALSLGGFTVTEILRDPAQSLRVSSLLGFLSNVGVWFWVAAGAICLSAAAQRPGSEASPPDMRQICLLLGGFSLLLAADDLFMIHDRFITEAIMVPIYIYILYRLLKTHRARVYQIEKTAFLTAAGLLAGSVLVDSVQEILPVSYATSQIVEEGCKFLGGAAWLYFCHRVGAYRVTATDDTRNAAKDTAAKMTSTKDTTTDDTAAEDNQTPDPTQPKPALTPGA